MGTSSTPGTQTITNWPGSNANARSKERVVTDGVSADDLDDRDGRQAHAWAHPTISAGSTPSSA